ncbi:MAG: phosphoribosylformylglycinamidine synthase I, partial [Syntrophomonadaceae bacterium]|nr:phosphoribosylformylglycinamidine synthase I [Syntrophomonadaceae bacterium]
RNKSLKFICEPVYLKVCRTDTAFTNQFQKEQIIKLPIAHGEGNYYCNAETLKELQDENRILFTYSSLAGEESPACNPNGSIANIAGIMNSRGNVLGMMPHPERYAEAVLGGDDGYYVFASMVSWFKGV